MAELYKLNIVLSKIHCSITSQGTYFSEYSYFHLTNKAPIPSQIAVSVQAISCRILLHLSLFLCEQDVPAFNCSHAEFRLQHPFSIYKLHFLTYELKVKIDTQRSSPATLAWKGLGIREVHSWMLGPVLWHFLRTWFTNDLNKLECLSCASLSSLV